MGNTPSNTDDTIDSRDVIARIEELEGERDDFVLEHIEAPEGTSWGEVADAEAAALAKWEAENADDAEELRVLKALAEEAEGYAPDWHHGETLIRDSYFEDYAQELAEEIGAIDSNASWPNNCIDWERAARELKDDYTAVDFDGETYWIR